MSQGYDPEDIGSGSKEMAEKVAHKPAGNNFKGHPKFNEIIYKMQQLHNSKNTDYSAGMKEGPLGNFYRVSDIMRLYPNMDWASPFGVAVAYMLKQFDAMMVLKSTSRKSVTGEPVSSRLFDVAVYTILEMILDEEENKPQAIGGLTSGTEESGRVR